MTSLKDHWIDDMGGWDTHTSSPEFELWCTCGCTFTSSEYRNASPGSYMSTSVEYDLDMLYAAPASTVPAV